MRTARTRTQRDYEDLYRATAPQLWRALVAYTAGRREIADEAVSEAFARALQHDGAIRQPVPWLYRTAFRIAAADLRRERREADIPAPIPHGGDPADDSTVTELMAALRRISPAQRGAVYLHYQADLPVREVARMLGTSAASIRVHLYQGRRRLRALLGSQEESDD